LERRGGAGATAELSAAMHAAENAAQVKSDFLATMSHEIRTPMHGVLSTLELLADTHLNSQQGDYLNTARKLQQLADDAAERHTRPVEDGSRTDGSASGTVLPTADSGGGDAAFYRRRRMSRGISLSSSCSPSLPEYFEGDEIRLRQVIFNLAGNAVKFTAEGRVTIGVGGQTWAGWDLESDHCNPRYRNRHSSRPHSVPVPGFRTSKFFGQQTICRYGSGTGNLPALGKRS